MKKAIFLSLLALIVTGCSTQPTIPEPQTSGEQGIFVDQTGQTFDVYFYLANDNGENGELIGCGDSISPMQKTVYAAPEDLLGEAITALLTAQEDIYGPFGLSNVFENTNLSLESVTTNNNITTINITGQLPLNGVCDHPRIQEQLGRTIGQFFPQNNFAITINSIPLEQALSLQ